MNNANAYTELTARTQFILDRVAFLQDVAATLMEEGTKVSDAKINVWLSNAYIPLIVRCIKSDDEPVRDEALWTVANLLGADTIAVREETKNALTTELLNAVLEYVFLATKETVEGAAFLLSNYARFKNISYMEAQSLISTACAKGIISNGKAATDLLWAANYAADKYPAAIPLSLVVNTLGDTSISKDKARQLRRLLGLAAEQSGLVHTALLGPVIGVLERQMKVSRASGVRAELYWILSNIITEPGAPELLFNHKELLSSTINACSIATHEGLQATYALANFVTMVKDTAIQATLGTAGTLHVDYLTPDNEFAFNIWNTFESLHNNEHAQRHILGKEVMQVLYNFEALYYVDDDDETETKDMDEDEYTEEEEEEEEDEDEDEDDSVIIDITPPTISVPLARTEENIASTEPAATEWNVRVPCAYELLYGSDRASCESRVVRNLVGLVENAMSDPTMEGDGWVKVPMDTIVSVSDLVTLQHMGYVFDGEWLGVNPKIYSGY